MTYTPSSEDNAPFGGLRGLTFRTSLRLIGRDLDPEVIEAQLRVAPDSAQRRGYQRRDREGRVYTPAAKGVFVVESGLEPTAKLSEHIEQLFSRFPRLEALRGNLPGVEAKDLFIGVFEIGDASCFELEPRHLLLCGELGLRITLDLYPADIDDEA